MWCADEESTGRSRQRGHDRTLTVAELDPFGCSTTGTEGPHIEDTLQQVEAMHARCRLPGLQHGRTLELLGVTAAHADQVVVIAMGIAGQLKTATTLGQLQLLQQPHGTEQAQGPVDGGQRDPLLIAQ